MSSPLLITSTGSVTTLTLNRPERRNALSTELLQRLHDALTETEAQAGQRVLILRGAGPVFCAGLDLAEASDALRMEQSAELIAAVLRTICGSRLVTIAGVQGAALAGGAGLACACDLVLAVRNATFGFPEVRRGLVPALIMAVLRRQLREREARELLLLGEPIDAPRAQALGLVNRIADDADKLDAETHAVCAAVLQGGPDAIAATKRLWTSLWPTTLEDDLARAHAAHLQARHSAEAGEGIAAFHARRDPSWVRPVQ